MVEATWRKYSAILYFNSLFTYYGKYNLKYRENWLSLFSFQEPVFSPHSVICVRIFVTIGIQKRCNVPVNCLCINCVSTVYQRCVNCVSTACVSTQSPHQPSPSPIPGWLWPHMLRCHCWQKSRPAFPTYKSLWPGRSIPLKWTK